MKWVNALVRASVRTMGREEDSLIARRLLGCSLSLSVPALTGPALIVLEDLADSTHS